MPGRKGMAIDTEVNPKVLKEMKKLQSWFNPSASRIVNDFLNEQAGRESIKLIVHFQPWMIVLNQEPLKKLGIILMKIKE